MNRQVLAIPLALIDVPSRLRALDPDWAALIAESMKERGQDTPIRVTEGDAKNGRHRLIAGMHRLEAARLAGFETIEAVVFSGSDLEAELLEIDENLIRRELSELDRATFLARRKAVWQALHPETKRGGDRRPEQRRKDASLIGEGLEARFSADVAAKLGLSAKHVDRVVRRHAALAEDVRARLATTPFADSGAQLDALARFDHASQRKIVAELLRETQPAGSVREAAIRLELIAAPAGDPTTLHLSALLAAWRKAGGKARKQFLDHIGVAAEHQPGRRGQGGAA